MGEVLLATDTRLHRTVAIKILPRDKVADPERKRRFILEARAASALNHPNIITLHDIANDGGVDYLVMEYAPGQPLSERIAAQGLPLSEAIEYAIQIANALSAAHEAGIVHRDIKPGNVVVTPQGQVKILDFGLAKLSERQSNSQNETRTEELPLTETGVVMGTIAYMSPEQARGDAVDARSDLFSFGAMLYEMVTGRRAFLQRLDWTTPPADYVPAGLRPIVVKLLKVDRDLRYQTAADAAADLKRLKASEATPSWKRWSVSATVMLLPSTNGLLILEVLSSTKMSTSDFSAGRKITVSY
jgi:serine/threonine protein kinase